MIKAIKEILFCKLQNKHYLDRVIYHSSRCPFCENCGKSYKLIKKNGGELYE